MSSKNDYDKVMVFLIENNVRIINTHEIGLIITVRAKKGFIENMQSELNQELEIPFYYGKETPSFF